jgi:hypothetical protein
MAITGDLTDGIGQFWSLEEFGQQSGDWSLMSSVIKKCRQHNVPVLFIRGNHDCFGVHSFQDGSNRAYRELHAQMIAQLPFDVHQDSGGSYAFHSGRSRFIFVENDRIIPGPHQYYGELSPERAQWLKAYIEGPTNLVAEQTFLFSHYPIGTLTIDSRTRTLAALANSKSPITYLSGHIHSVVGTNGIQATRSHGMPLLNELQISDYKWSGIVRKVDIGSGGIFVDIPTISTYPNVSASLLFHPSHNPQTSLLTVYSQDESIKFLHACKNQDLKFKKIDDYGLMSVFNITGVSSVDLECIEDHSGRQVYPVDTRLWFGTPKWFLFTYWFESLQIIVLALYLGTVWFSRKIFLCQTSTNPNVLIPLYLVLSPLIPNSLSEHLYKREWLVANGVALFDLRSHDVIMDTETTRVGFMMFLYFLTSVSLNFRLSLPSNRLTLGSWLWLAFLAFPQFMDVRFIIGRGGFRSLLLSPHTWYMIWYWYKWLHPKSATQSRTSV